MNSQKALGSSKALAFALFFSLHLHAQADNSIKFGRTAIFNNPFVVVAQNPKSKVISGYLEALRTSPGRTDECKFIFRGKPLMNNISELSIVDAVSANLNEGGVNEIAHGTFKKSGDKNFIVVDPANLLGECDWILDFVGRPSVIRVGKQFEISFKIDEISDWIAVSVIRSKRAYFYVKPNGPRKGKAFIVAGDLIYIYDENLNWYFVKFQTGKKETAGWIKKTDTIQISE